jgi:hypothetical protein
MTFRTQIHTKKFGKKCFRNQQGTMSHRLLTNTSSLKIAAAYCSGLSKNSRTWPENKFGYAYSFVLQP